MKQTQKLSQWISIRDELPKEDDKVLVYSVENAHHYGIGFYSKTYQSFFVNRFADDGVTHWMPLPKEPKPEMELLKNDRP